MKLGRYEVIDRIGAGPVAEVFSARLEGPFGFEKVVVIKRLLPDRAGDASTRDAIIEEARLAARVSQQNIVQVLGLETTESGEIFMVMEHVQGVDLRLLLRVSIERGLRLPIWFSLHVIAEVLSGVAYAHELRGLDGRSLELVHRDVSPSNIFISMTGDVKLGGFGMAKTSARASHTRPGEIRGRLGYASPEQISGLRLDQRSDIFSVGAVLWEMLCQRRLFTGDADYAVMNNICSQPSVAPSRYNSAVSPALDTMVLEALAVDREARIPTASSLLRDVIGILWSLQRPVLREDVRRVVEGVVGVGSGALVLDALEVSDMDAAELSAGFTTSVMRPHDEMLDDFVDETDRSVDEPSEGGFDRLQTVIDPRARGEFVTNDIPLIVAPEAEPGTFLARPDPWIVSPARRSPPPPPPPDPDEIDEMWIELSSSGVEPSAPSIEIPRVEVIAHEGASTIDLRTPPESFWILTRNLQCLGPLDFERFVRELYVSDYRKLPAKVSIDGEDWVELAEFAVLSGQEGLVPLARAKGTKHSSGSLRGLELAATMVALEDRAFSGRLLLFGHGSNVETSPDCEILMSSGAPRVVHARLSELQVPAILIRQRVVTNERLVSALRQTMHERRPLAEIVCDGTRYKGDDLRPLIVRERLIELLGPRQWQYVLEPQTQDEGLPASSVSFKSILIHALSRKWSIDELELATRPIRQARLYPTKAFDESIRGFALSADDARLLVSMLGTPISVLLAQTGIDHRRLLAMAAVLVHCGLLGTDIPS